MEQWWNDKDMTNLRYWGDKTVPACHFVHNISHVDLHGIEPRCVCHRKDGPERNHFLLYIAIIFIISSNGIIIIIIIIITILTSFFVFSAHVRQNSWSRFPLEKMEVAHLPKIYATYHWTWADISTFITAGHLPISWASWIQSTPSHPNCLRYYNTINALDFKVVSLPPVFPPYTHMHLSSIPCVPHAPPISTYLFDFINFQISNSTYIYFQINKFLRVAIITRNFPTKLTISLWTHRQLPAVEHNTIWGLHSSVVWTRRRLIATDVSGQPTSPTFKGQAVEK